MPTKPKNPQKKTPTKVSMRDEFQTPNYGIEILVPYLQKIMSPNSYIWECACGQGKIVKLLKSKGYTVTGTDLKTGFNFLYDVPYFPFDCIVTNTPFSIKEEFYKKCRSYKVPFALLVPADYAIWVNRAVGKDGCEKIIPERRIDYITPDILTRIHEGEIWKNSKQFYPKHKTLKEFKEKCPDVWNMELDKFSGYCNWDSIYDAPAKLLKKYSSSQFHSMWLTWGFGLGKSETFVELTNEMKDNI